MNGQGPASANGHHPGDDATSPRSNPYLTAARGEEPDEIVQYELSSNPYANMLPGISSVNAARTVAQGVEVGRRGNKGIQFVSFFLLIVILAPLIVAAIAYLTH